MKKNKLVIHGIYRHFKGHIYEVLLVGKDADTLKEKVVYQNVFKKEEIWIRDLEEFLSEVDHKKYKEVEQKYRFEWIKDSM